jgi:hypothetical protein
MPDARLVNLGLGIVIFILIRREKHNASHARISRLYRVREVSSSR